MLPGHAKWTSASRASGESAATVAPGVRLAASERKCSASGRISSIARLRYRRGAPNLHVLWGWMQVAQIVDVAQTLSDRGIRVIVAGLDMDFRGEPFGSMPVFMAKAESVLKLHAICMVCGDEASRTQRLVNGKPARYDEPVVIVGASELYEARCRLHHEVPR